MRSVLVTLADEGYLNQAKQIFSSAYFFGEWRGDCLLLAFDVPEEKLSWFRSRGIFVFAAQPFNQDYERKAQILFSKLELFKTYFKRWDKVIYLDTDMIIRRSLRGLLNYDGLCGVQGVRKATVRDRIPLPKPNEPEDKKRLYKELESQYFLDGPGINGGLYLINTNLIQDKTYKQLCDFVIKYRSLFNGYDECVICTLFSQNLRLLPLSYNVYIRLYGMNHPDKAKGTILHFVDSACTNPWDTQSPFHLQWTSNLERSEELDFQKNDVEQNLPIPENSDFHRDEKILRNKFQFYRNFVFPTSQLTAPFRRFVKGLISNISS